MLYYGLLYYLQLLCCSLAEADLTLTNAALQVDTHGGDTRNGQRLRHAVILGTTGGFPSQVYAELWR